MRKVMLLVMFTGMLCLNASAQFTHNGRGMYVDRFFRTAINTSGATVINPVFSILGIPAKEDSLLNYARENHITYLILYDLYYVIGNATYEGYLCDFIEKAKTQYCIEYIGVASSCSGLFDNIFSVTSTASISFSDPDFAGHYSSSLQAELEIVEEHFKPGDSLFYQAEVTKLSMRVAAFNEDCAYKIDVLVSEYEFWNATVDDCQGDSPTRDQKYLRYQALIDNMDAIRDNYNLSHATHKLYVESYLGYLHLNTAYSHQTIANWIDGAYSGKRRVDRILNHYYGSDPLKLYSRTATGWNNTGYYLTRFVDFSQSSTVNQTNLYPIFSSEYIPWGAGGSFLGSWFSLGVSNNIFSVEKTFYNDWYDDAQNYRQSTLGSPTLGNVIKPGGAIWFTSSQMEGHINDPILFTSNSPVCIPSGQNTGFQFQYQGPIEQGTSFKFYLTNAGNNTVRAGTTNSITWPAYNPAAQTSIELNAALGSYSLPAGDYDAHLELTYSASCAPVMVPVVRVSIVNTGKIVALTPTTACQGHPVYLKANSTAGATTSYAWYDGTTPIAGATSPTYAPSNSAGVKNYSCLITTTVGGCSANRSNVIPVTINAFPAAAISTQSTSSCSVTLLATPAGSSYIWHDGSIGSTYTTNIPGIYSVAVTKNGCTGLSSKFNVDTIIGMGNVIPALLISSNKGTSICYGTTVVFSATPSNGGTAPIYQWKKNGSNAGTNSNFYTASNLANNDVITCVLTSNLSCASPLTATGNSLTMTVSPVVVPTVSVASNLGSTICAGSNVTFTATPVNGGTTPSYQWKKNGINVGLNSNSYSDNALTNLNNINCVMISSAGCPTVTTVTSNNVVMTVNSASVPSVTIVSNQVSSICSGTSVTFTATPVNGGTTPSYQWKKNGSTAGTNSNTYVTSSLSNNDIITCVLSSNLLCATPVTATSNNISMTVNPNLVASVAINVNPGNNICAGTNVNFTATPVNGGSSPTYQWKKNGTSVGTNSANYNDNSITNSNVITCVMTNSATCATPVQATSNSIPMAVNSVVAPSVSISSNSGNSICDGATVIYTATPTNGGAPPFFQWKVNGMNTGSNSSTFSSSNIANNDIISCAMTSTAYCASPSVVSSNNIVMSVFSINTPSVSITSTTGNSICMGSPVTFTATSNGAGVNPTFQWKRNGIDVGTNSDSYTENIFSNNVNFHCVMTSSSSCVAGSAVSDTITLTVNPCVQLDLKVFIQGFYLGGNKMNPVIDPISNPSICDTITVELRESTPPFSLVSAVTDTIDVFGNGKFFFPNTILNQVYYIVLKHRNSLETWSSSAVSIVNPILNFDFSISANRAYGTNQASLGDGNFGLWSGDLGDGITPGVKDGIINENDHLIMNNALQNFSTGYILPDLTGDGLVESADFSLMENNYVTTVTVSRP